MTHAMLPCAFSADRVVIVVDREVSVIPSCLCTRHAYLPVRNCLSWIVVVFCLFTGYMVSSPNLCHEMLPFLPCTSRCSWLLISARIFRNTQEVMLALVFVYYGSILNPLRIVNVDSLKGWREGKVNDCGYVRLWVSVLERTHSTRVAMSVTDACWCHLSY